ncbi:Ribosome biogenesis ATPase RIX7 [Cyberlindnera fabianii]|uniref:Ribosome biogenesis ATPase RIX7 n=1 Tax=Cyberlindnera fabianii TaxID=36022 RepID=A0A1V2L776_CYBFA|nr:Ribosome biogenesis ATPase RIX7 [Cyberlindnera fabianii]
MVKIKSGKKGTSLVQSLDLKLAGLIDRLLEEKTAVNKRNNPDEEDEVSLIAMAKDLTLSETMLYAQQKDLSLQRVKKVVLEKTLERILNQIREEERAEFESVYGHAPQEEENDSDFDGVEVDELMDVQDTNDMNKSVVNVWNIKPADVPTPAAETPEVTEKEDTSEVKDEVENDSKKSKKRSKDSSRPSKRQKVDKNRAPPTSSLSELGGMDEVITQLMEIVGMPILHPEIYKTTGVEPPRGVLLHGPPGCGKTTIANALAGDLKVPFISISAPSVVSGMSGESEKKIRELFDEAKTLAPCIIFFDEIDAITPKREGAQREMERRIVAQMLTSIDELSLDKTNGQPVIIIGATNRPDSLDPALRRAGRFDREICLNVPNEASRLHILKKMSSKLKIDGELDFARLAKATPGYVGADLKALTAAAGICAIKRISSTLTDDSDLLTQGLEPESLESLSTIQKFLLRHPTPLTAEQLAPLAITYEDFLTALPTIQPTAKREGFATVPDVTWASVGALTQIRIELNMAIVQPIRNPGIYERVGIHAPAGVLMWGPPGCGKTLLAKAVANESRANFISIKGPELLNKYVGESEKAIRQVFTRARASVPCVIFFDELDALVPRRDSSLSESSSRVVNTLLTELDGLNDRKGIFVIGATNRPDMIDPAMLRPGRLDKTLFIELPNAQERLDILKTVINVNKTPVADDVDLSAISHDERCRNFSGADLSSMVREAGVIALKKKFFTLKPPSSDDQEMTDGDSDEQIFVTKDDFERALNSVKPSVNDRDRAKYERLNKKMGWSLAAEPTNDEPSKAEE